MDGNQEGGLRLFPGFLKVHETTVSDSNHDGTSKVMKAIPFHARVAADGYMYGYAVLLRRKQPSGGTTADVFVSYYNSKTGTWTTGQKVMTACSSTAQFDVEVWGRFVYVASKGRSPALFYLDPDSPYALTVVGNAVTDTLPGPGIRPKLLPYDRSYPILTITDTESDNQPGYGQILLTTSYPDQQTIWPGGESDSGSGECSGDAPQEQNEVRLLEPGNYTFAYVLVDSRTGRRSALSQIATIRQEDFLTTSETASNKFALLELVWDTSKYDQARVYRSVRAQTAGGTYIESTLHLEAVITLEDYLTCQQPTEPNRARMVYYYTLTDEQLTFKPVWFDQEVFDEQMPPAGELFLYGNTVFASSIANPTKSAPSATTPVLSAERSVISDVLRGIGELRWSATSEVAPELFPPGNRYIPNSAVNEITRIERAGANAIGFSIDRQYFIRKDTIYVTVQEIHDGFGVVAPTALDTVGSLVYFVSSKGVKAVNSDGALDDVRAFNDVVMREWADDLSGVTVAYDGFQSACYIFNPAFEHLLVLWFNTARATEVHDCFFADMRRGLWPNTPLSPSGDLVSRALFFQDVPRDSDTDSVSGIATVRVFVVDANREKTVTSGTSPFSGQPHNLLMTVAGDVRFATSAAFSSGATLSLTVPGTHTLTSDICGCYLYVLDSSDPAFIGRKALIRNRPSSSTVRLAAADAPNLIGLPSGSRVGISPVFFRWTGSPLGQVAPDGTEQGVPLQVIKHLNTIRCAFADVSGNATGDGTTDARFQGQAYRGNDEEPAATGFPRLPSGNAVTSLLEGEGLYAAALGDDNNTAKHGVKGFALTPSVQIFTPDVDFLLLEVSVSGQIEGSGRTQRPTGV